MTPHQLARATHRHTRTRQSYATLKRHAQSPRGLCETSALRLLRRNVRDVHPDATYQTQQTVARILLDAMQRRWQGAPGNTQGMEKE